MSLHRKLSASSVLLGTLLFTLNFVAQNPAADLVLIHGHILTVDATDSVAQAIAVRHGVIVKVGTDAEVHRSGLSPDKDHHRSFFFRRVYCARTRTPSRS